MIGSRLIFARLLINVLLVGGGTISFGLCDFVALCRLGWRVFHCFFRVWCVFSDGIIAIIEYRLPIVYSFVFNLAFKIAIGHRDY